MDFLYQPTEFLVEVVQCEAVACQDEAVNVGGFLGVWVPYEKLHLPDSVSQLPRVNIVPVGAHHSVCGGWLPRGVDWGCCYAAGPLQVYPSHKLVSAADFVT